MRFDEIPRLCVMPQNWRLGSTRCRLRLQPLRIDAGFGQFYDVLQLTIDPEFDRKAVEVVIQAYPGGISGEVLDCLGEPAMASLGNGFAVEGNAQVVAHSLNLLMVAAFEPGQNCIGGK